MRFRFLSGEHVEHLIETISKSYVDKATNVVQRDLVACVERSTNVDETDLLPKVFLSLSSCSTSSCSINREFLGSPHAGQI